MGQSNKNDHHHYIYFILQARQKQRTFRILCLMSSVRPHIILYARQLVIWCSNEVWYLEITLPLEERIWLSYTSCYHHRRLSISLFFEWLHLEDIGFIALEWRISSMLIHWRAQVSHGSRRFLSVTLLLLVYHDNIIPLWSFDDARLSMALHFMPTDEELYRAEKGNNTDEWLLKWIFHRHSIEDQDMQNKEYRRSQK